MNKHKLEEIELSTMDVFSDRKTGRLLTKELFQALPQYANADLVRAFEDLEKTKRLIVRSTLDGHDWIILTKVGADCAGIELLNESVPTAHPHPPRSSTLQNY